MAPITITEGATWAIATLATGGVIVRPWGWPEAIWAVLGAATLVATSLVPWPDAVAAVESGTDVYLFLAGMMLLAESARQHGVFAWLAAIAASYANGSGERLFVLVFAVGTIVTVFLSNDATAVVLTPAVYAVTRAAGAEPLPYLYVCAFIANAASFVLPISNPANLVLFGGQIPPLSSWIARFIGPSLVAIGTTFLVLRLTQRDLLNKPIGVRIQATPLPRAGRMSAWGIAAAVVALLTASASGTRLGLPTFLAGVSTSGIVLLVERRAPWELIRSVGWGVIALVAGLFALVQGLVRTGVIDRIGHVLAAIAEHSPAAASWVAGIFAALACNLTNNLPVGLISGSLVASGSLPGDVHRSLLVGVDLGPNLSITGSLATILWLAALRREGHDVRALDFLRLGAIVTVPSLVAALAALRLMPLR
ncbi:MAG TPA: arsenic transporter [Xanthobacteraceae bacterium]|jgi:arsenical pump membrane protein|nr:arsenic transporter [Xanthobacteraceae bacterium]